MQPPARPGRKEQQTRRAAAHAPGRGGGGRRWGQAWPLWASLSERREEPAPGRAVAPCFRLGLHPSLSVWLQAALILRSIPRAHFCAGLFLSFSTLTDGLWVAKKGASRVSGFGDPARAGQPSSHLLGVSASPPDPLLCGAAPVRRAAASLRREPPDGRSPRPPRVSSRAALPPGETRRCSMAGAPWPQRGSA